MFLPQLAIKRIALMEAWEFCLNWFDVPPEDRDQPERGFRAKCVRELSELLSLEQNTIDQWGKRLENMPARYQRELGRIHSLKAIAIEIAKYPELRRILENKAL
ncbi:hypothetical protein IQ235_00915 [Oscillatoriales cyanobacterium LEGE 11467]|uniref:Uncharacterized protein n=1 Tax=Zarconia navalis LEGE 11467 TaxID=1828826 RepID=A0A928Z814_9CYAN|nr:hypothetical protein [Zarconia navalis]MBE9039356.1 hypothetical protein [Zarconia navalis LEGE 11467]